MLVLFGVNLYCDLWLLVEAMYWLRNQRTASMPLYAQEPILFQVPHLEASHFTAVRLLHHDYDCA